MTKNSNETKVTYMDLTNIPDIIDNSMIKIEKLRKYSEEYPELYELEEQIRESTKKIESLQFKRYNLEMLIEDSEGLDNKREKSIISGNAYRKIDKIINETYNELQKQYETEQELDDLIKRLNLDL